jgi:hypothetical protein
MIVERIPLDCIDGSDQTYRISEALESDVLQESLRRSGQLNPVLLEAGDGTCFRIVAGFRRVHALNRAGVPDVFARVMPLYADALSLFSTAVWDNLSHRKLTSLEQARVLSRLVQVCRLPPDAVVEWLPALGLPAHRNVLQSYLALDRLSPRLRTLFREEKLTLQSAERLAAQAPADQDAAADLFDRIRLSASLQRQMLDLVDEIAADSHCSAGDVLRRPEMCETVRLPAVSSFQLGERVYQRLFEIRNPMLSRARRRFSDAVGSLRLPGNVRLSPDPYFETTRVKVEYEASSPEEFRRISSAVAGAGSSAALDDIFEVE